MIPPESLPVFSESQIARFQSDGWLFVHGLFPQELVVDAQKIAEAVYSTAAEAKNNKSRRKRSFPNKAPVFNKLPLHPRLLKATQELLDENEYGIRLIHSAVMRHGATHRNPPEESRKYSSVWGDDAVGTGHARSMLGSMQAWSASRNLPGEWMQIDLGEERSVAGTIVQGRSDWAKGQHVTKYTVQYSVDGTEWNDIAQEFHGACGDSKIVNAFFSPVHARYIRLVVQEWNEHISMRAGLLMSASDAICKNRDPGSEWDSGHKFCLVAPSEKPEGLIAILYLSSCEDSGGPTTRIADCRSSCSDQHRNVNHKTIEHTLGSVLFLRLDTHFRDDLIGDMIGAQQITHRIVLRSARAEWVQSDVFIRHLSGVNLIGELDPVQRSALGFPHPGHPHWTRKNISLVANRYHFDPNVYLAACRPESQHESHIVSEAVPCAPAGAKEKRPDFTWTEAARLVTPEVANGVGENTLSPSQIQQWREEGWLLVDGIFPEELVDEVAASVAGASGFAIFPSAVSAVNHFILHPKLIQAVSELLQVSIQSIRLTQAMCGIKRGSPFESTRSPSGIPTWETASYTGNQPMHQDFRNNELLTPARCAELWETPDHVTAIAYFNDYTEAGGGTCFVPGLRHSRSGERLHKVERRPAYTKGSILFYTLGTWHRGTPVDPDCIRRHAFLTFRLSEAEWIGGAPEVGAPSAASMHSLSESSDDFDMHRFIGSLTVDQRAVLGFPAVGNAYWNEGTLRSVRELYGPALDLQPYAPKASAL